MPSLNFQPRFAELVASGTKRQTIRPLGKRTIEPGDRLSLFTGLRTKQVRRLGETDCTETLSIRMDLRDDIESCVVWLGLTPRLSHRILPAGGIAYLAKKDGFKTVKEFLRFFRETHGEGRFEGMVIRW